MQLAGRQAQDRAAAWRSGVALVLLVFLAAGGDALAYPSPLRSPVDVGAQRQAFAHPGGAAACPVPAKLPGALETLRYYTDDANSIVDPAVEAVQRQRDAPVRAAEEALAAAVTGFVQTEGPTAAAYGDCILAHLRRFAQDEAFLHTTQFRGTGSVRLAATGPVMAYVIRRDGGAVPAADDAAIRAWIAVLAGRIVAWEAEYPYRNNISYWAGAALAMAAVALNEKRYLEAALAIARTAAAEVTAEGVLPREMARGERSLEYSLFATQALATIAIVADANGVDLLRERDGALLRLLRTMAASVLAPERFVALSHDPRSILPDRIYRQNLAWLAAYVRLTGDTAVVPLLCRTRPLDVFRAGGDWFVLLASGPGLCGSRP